MTSRLRLYDRVLFDGYLTSHCESHSSCSEKSLPNCHGVIDPVVFFETESLS